MQPSAPELGEETRSLAQPDPGSATQRNPDRPLGWLYVLAGMAGFIASFTLLVEKIALLNDPSYVPTCSINPILSCGSIMQSAQSEAFGFPNPIIGVAGFAIVVTTGMALLAGGGFRPWFWRGMLIGTSGGVAFVHWLIFQTLYRIGVLCPYCMVVWAVTIPLFWYTVLRGMRNLPAGRRGGRVARVLSEYHGVVLTVWYLLIAALVAERFWDYWSILLG